MDILASYSKKSHQGLKLNAGAGKFSRIPGIASGECSIPIIICVILLLMFPIRRTEGTRIATLRTMGSAGGKTCKSGG